MSDTSVSSAGGERAWPTLPSERTWKFVALLGVSTSAAVATWCFLIGGYVAYYLPAGVGTFAMLAGGLVGILLIVLALVPVATRYGVDSVVASKPQLGSRGSYFAMFLLYASVIGWNCLLLIFLGNAAGEILISTGVAGEGSRGMLRIVFGLAAVAVVWLLLRGGPNRVRNVGPFIAGGVTILAIWLLVQLITDVGWSTISSATPAYASGDKLWDYVTGFEILVAVNLSWWPYVGGMIRLAPGARSALWPVVLGLGIPVSIISLIGLYAGLAIPESGGDPTKFIVALGGLGTGVPALVFIVLANIGTTMVGVYVTAVGLRQVSGVNRLPWNGTTAVGLIPVAFVIAFASDWFYNHSGSFFALMGVLFAPMCGIQIADYYVFRKLRVDPRGLFRYGPDTPYHFWFGVNPAGFAGVATGFFTYVYLLDPVAYTSNAPYQYVSASIPAAVMAAVVYALVTRLVVIPARKGGYEQSAAATATPRPLVSD